VADRWATTTPDRHRTRADIPGQTAPDQDASGNGRTGCEAMTRKRSGVRWLGLSARPLPESLGAQLGVVQPGPCRTRRDEVGTQLRSRVDNAGRLCPGGQALRPPISLPLAHTRSLSCKGRGHFLVTNSAATGVLGGQDRRRNLLSQRSTTHAGTRQTACIISPG
jgi:hypothetical protein